MNKGFRHYANRGLFWLLIVVITVYLIFPFYWALNSSLKSENQLSMTPATFIPRDALTREISFTFANYGAVFQNEAFGRGLVNSTIVAGSVVLLALLVGSFAAFALGKLRFRGKEPSLYVVLSMTMFPQVAVLTGLYAVIRNLELPGIPSMILSYMLFSLPFTTWVLTSFFQGLPDELMQSAQVDGATPFQTFYMILLPLTAPALVTTGLLAFIGAWNEYLFALTFTTIEPAARTVPVVIALFTGQVARQEPFGEIMAAAVLVTIPLLILVLIFQQRIVAGLTAGAVKG
ncbi:MAG: carbohydrate ABC transporter permease [Anaerolineales bacterium]|nr:carbohydrate ABC transporter permease [Anaerolineales bacterium]MCB0010732.1 carbohydrate ABC transporter permease [Anaerolineales bacterium]MCB0017719.1 carbohydrate ABC transporter permease [Anaerolineales bacterium]MCB0027252.1 carbohydrate ABC transporter permease [Anaerolineales bacterium]MCB8959422.1 carbohydrate ABC transporter permease [Ardenticatenales bacterium]